MSVGRGVRWPMTTVERCRTIDMKDFAREIDMEQGNAGVIKWFSSAGDLMTSMGWMVKSPRQLLISYSFGSPDSDDRRDLMYQVGCGTTPCNFGGLRYWYLCPSCGSRRRILYLPPNGDVFACRECHRLTYKSRQEAKNPWEPLFTYLNDIPKWEAELRRARSLKKRRRLAARIGRAYQNLVALNKWHNAIDAKRSRRRKSSRR